MLYFVSSSKNKFAEAKAIIPELEQVEISLEEIQSLDPHEIIKAKLDTASRISIKTKPWEIIVDDTSLYLDALNGKLPGPFTKWFEQAIGVEGIAELAKGNNKARAVCLIGYQDEKGAQFFEGTLEGVIVPPRGKRGFGFDAIFQPDGFNQTFGEMDLATKNLISHRRKAFEKLKQYLALRG